jgi:hypothetical protein
MDAADISRQRLDFEPLPGGAVKAILTVTLPGGVIKRFESITTAEEAQQVEGDIVGAELMLDPTLRGEVGFNIFKSVKKLAKKVASSKVFKVAASGLALAAPLLGPVAPAALAAAAGMGVASKLAHAGVAAAKGAKKLSASLTASAAADARKLTKTPAGAASLLATANKRRLGAEKLADGGSSPPPPAAAPAPKAPAARPAARAARAVPAAPPAKAPAAPAPAAPARAPSLALPPRTAPANLSGADLLARARAGRVRSNDGRPVTDAELLAAHAQGRIFWVS